MKAALLLQFVQEPPPRLFVGLSSSQARLHRLQEFYRGQKRELEARLANEEVEVQDLPSMGAVIVQGSAEALAHLQRPGGPLDRDDVNVIEDAEFVTQAPRP